MNPAEITKLIEAGFEDAVVQGAVPEGLENGVFRLLWEHRLLPVCFQVFEDRLLGSGIQRFARGPNEQALLGLERDGEGLVVHATKSSNDSHHVLTS